MKKTTKASSPRPAIPLPPTCRAGAHRLGVGRRREGAFQSKATRTQRSSNLLGPCREDARQLARIDRPRLVVVIDTEEEFDWRAGFSPHNTAVRAMQSIHVFQRVLDEYHVTPVYVVDYAVASQPMGFRPLQEVYDDGRCLVGAHLHPWVNPPLEESFTARNSYPGNLPPALEAAKLRVLGDEIEERFGVRPAIYKAGRYGIGPATASILEEHGFEIDLSICPYTSFAADGGPNFLSVSPCPFWFGQDRRLLELPLTVGFTWLLRGSGPHLLKLASHQSLAPLHPIGALARLHLARRVWLSPESNSATDQIRLVRALSASGQQVFSLAFHSPSAVPGNTPFVRSQRDLSRLLDRLRQVLDFFLGDFGGLPSTPLELLPLLCPSHTRTQDSAVE